MKQISAVDWMATEIIEAIQHGDKDFVYWKLKTVILEQAKELEKQQIIDAYIDASPKLEDITKESAEQYYQETYKSK
jgi:HEPN domain-containing protein